MSEPQVEPVDALVERLNELAGRREYLPVTADALREAATEIRALREERDEWAEKHAVVVGGYNLACEAAEAAEAEATGLRKSFTDTERELWEARREVSRLRDALREACEEVEMAGAYRAIDAELGAGEWEACLTKSEREKLPRWRALLTEGETSDE